MHPSLLAHCQYGSTRTVAHYGSTVPLQEHRTCCCIAHSVQWHAPLGMIPVLASL